MYDNLWRCKVTAVQNVIGNKFHAKGVSVGPHGVVSRLISFIMFIDNL